VEDDVNWSRGGMLTGRQGREKHCTRESIIFLSVRNPEHFFFAQFASYWDWLPPELALPIRTMATKHFWIEEKEKELRQQVVEELHHYHRVRQAWGLGRLTLYQRRGMLDIWGTYWDIENNRVRQAFLGSGKWASAWKQALLRVNHVTSFLLVCIKHNIFSHKVFNICKMNTTFTKSVLIM